MRKLEYIRKRSYDLLNLRDYRAQVFFSSTILFETGVYSNSALRCTSLLIQVQIQVASISSYGIEESFKEELHEMAFHFNH